MACEVMKILMMQEMRFFRGYMFMLNGCLINWKVCLQHVVTLFTIEVEFTTDAESIKEAIWLEGLIAELGYKQYTVLIFCDNSNALHLCKTSTHHEKTKHIDIKLH